MPGMIDTHRHMWQTAMRAYGADWTLTQYFVWYYLEHGKTFRPEDIHAGNLLSAWESLEAGVTTTVDWSHGLQTVDHADAAVDALQAVPGRFVLAYGNIQAGPWEWTADPAVRDFFERRRTGAGDMLGFQLAFDVTGDPAFPEKAAFEVARELGLAVTTHAGVWGATNDDGIRLIHENGFVDTGEHLRARGHAQHRLLPADRGDRRLGLGVDGVRAERRPGLPARPGRCGSTASRCRCRWTPACGGAATCSRRCGRRSAPTARASTSRRTSRATPSPRCRCAPSRSSTGRPAAAPRRSAATTSAGSTPGAKADVVLIKNDHSPVSFPLLNPYGHVAFQAQRGDVHTVIVDGRVVKSEGKLVGFDAAAVRRTVDATVDHLKADDGRGASGTPACTPSCPRASKVLDNPYQYTDYQSESTHGARGTMFGDPGSGSLGRRDVAGRGSGPDFVESLARGLDVLRCFDAHHRAMSLAEVATATGLARPDRPPAAADARGARLRPLGRRRLRADAEGDHARHGVRRAPSASGTSPAPTSRRWSARPVSRRRWPSSTGRDIVYVARVSVPKIIALRVDIGTLLPGAPDLPGQGAARRALTRRAGRAP